MRTTGKKKPFTIAQKIWFSLSILILGYLFSTAFGYFLGYKTESNLLQVSDQRFPITQKSEAALTEFKKQVTLYSDAVVMGETDLIDSADAQADEVKRLLLEIADLETDDHQVRENVLETVALLKRFSVDANGVYKRLSLNPGEAATDQALAEQAKQLARLTETITSRLKRYTEEFSNHLKTDLAQVRAISRQQRHLNLLIFAGVVICSVFLIAVIISRSIMAPLQRTFMLEKVAEQFADGIAVTDLDGRIEFVNRAWGEMHGYASDAIIGERLEMFHTPEQAYSELLPLFEAARAEGLGTGEVHHKHKDGGLIPTSMAISKIQSETGEAIGMICSARDITVWKRNEAELHQAKIEAEAANASKSIFLANMSHEIRTPLNGVMGVLNLLLSTSLDQEQLDLVRTGKTSADNLLTVISDILDFSKIEAGKLDIEILDFDLRNTVDEVVELPALQSQGKGLEFAYLIDPAVPALLSGDPGRLRQIILNLTNNAIKFTSKGEVFLRITLVAETDTDAKIKFEVIDTGIGIPEDKRRLIFSAFQQTDTSITRRYGGTGLGLSISKKLVEMMSGEVGVESKEHHGSTFWFTALLPKQPRQETALPALPVSIAGKRLLIVDDNKTNLEILGGYLAAWKCRFDLAQSGEMALSLLNAVAKVDAPFDAVIVDMLMPGMDGDELGKRIKSDPAFKTTKLIMLTSMGMRGEALKMKEIGFNAYLTKPIRRSQLFNCLASLFSRQPVASGERTKAFVTKHSLTESEKSKIRILIAEDNAINLKLVTHMIKKFGFRTDAATNGKEALKMLEAFHFDLVLMDYHMPEMDGLEATRQIRDPQSKVIRHDVPIIALTANAMKGDRETCIAAGMNDYVPKPINPQELLEAIEKNLRSAKLAKSALADAGLGVTDGKTNQAVAG